MFRPSQHGTTAGREILAGVTTSAAMAYILVVNPDILSLTGLRISIPITSTALTDAAAQRPFVAKFSANCRSKVQPCSTKFLEIFPLQFKAGIRFVDELHRLRCDLFPCTG